MIIGARENYALSLMLFLKWSIQIIMLFSVGVQAADTYFSDSFRVSPPPPTTLTARYRRSQLPRTKIILKRCDFVRSDGGFYVHRNGA